MPRTLGTEIADAPEGQDADALTYGRARSEQRPVREGTAGAAVLGERASKNGLLVIPV